MPIDCVNQDEPKKDQTAVNKNTPLLISGDYRKNIVEVMQRVVISEGSTTNPVTLPIIVTDPDGNQAITIHIRRTGHGVEVVLYPFYDKGLRLASCEADFPDWEADFSPE